MSYVINSAPNGERLQLASLIVGDHILASKPLKFVGFNPKPRVSESLGKYIGFISETSGFTTIWSFVEFKILV